MNGVNSFEAHMVTINAKEEALSGFTSWEPTLCVAGLQMLILSFAFFGSRVAQPLLRNCSRTHRQILLTQGCLCQGQKWQILIHFRHIISMRAAFWCFPKSLLAIQMRYYHIQDHFEPKKNIFVCFWKAKIHSFNQKNVLFIKVFSIIIYNSSIIHD